MRVTEQSCVRMISFTGGSVDKATFGKDYPLQSRALKDIFRVYYEKGVAAGFNIFSWASDLGVANAEAFGKSNAYTYTPSNKPVARAFVDIASALGSRNTTNIPLQFVQVASR
jgi:hypothetical protein